ncbi:hypothetical protein GH714_021166 [Hevea brasiliensis]|uniref:Uncharacterized protein n=1 Tax=Hevea brasiliensis TaxID=3981 RepID=A0A6A6LVM9_HEVBR|nr:hypothetical protein GH714_021166 [Hevea brasiliensis]
MTSSFHLQLAALDFIACTAADAFAMTDSCHFGLAGYRTYNGGGRMPTIRPNKRRLAAIFMKNSTIEWKVFEQRVRKAVRQTKHIFERPIARSVYRFPRCKELVERADAIVDGVHEAFWKPLGSVGAHWRTLGPSSGRWSMLGESGRCWNLLEGAGARCKALAGVGGIRPM